MTRHVGRRARLVELIASNPSMSIGCALLSVIALSAVAAPLISVHDPLLIPRGGARQPPSIDHWFGTDQLGRDVFARVMYGARTSLGVGVGAALLATSIGVPIGALAGYRRGWVDALLTRLTEMFLVFPAVLIASLLIVVLGRGSATIAIVLGLVGWPLIARVSRGAVMQVVAEEWVDAARAVGCSETRNLFVHVLPHAIAPVAVVCVLFVSTAILGEATLSYLAIGTVEPSASWGLMIAGGQSALHSAPHVVIFPALALVVTIGSLMLMAEGLRQSLGVDR